IDPPLGLGWSDRWARPEAFNAVRSPQAIREVRTQSKLRQRLHRIDMEQRERNLAAADPEVIFHRRILISTRRTVGSEPGTRRPTSRALRFRRRHNRREWRGDRLVTLQRVIR